MTLWDLLSAICLGTPIFIGVIEGKNAGIIGIILGAILGLMIGIVATFTARKAVDAVSIFLLRHDKKHPVFAECMAALLLLIHIVWIFGSGFLTLSVLKQAYNI